ncbi:hypothetical protein [Streptomyces sp. SID2888]|uniref:hypothetical protein n=1 Tax=Streptomyces sp. SID2888 TaxID=2690256 RepID=UPI0013815BF2|nr:hypothetical protein [Streptomyces sp. SID2888]MYV44834.1 hypothetical protein [Streptomyces sp. SID2888]
MTRHAATCLGGLLADTPARAAVRAALPAAAFFVLAVISLTPARKRDVSVGAPDDGVMTAHFTP